MSPFLLFLLICLSMHACNARYLGLEVDKEAEKQGFSKSNFQGLVQDVDKVNLDETSISSGMMPPSKEGLGARGQKEVVSHDRSIHKSLLGASTMKLNNLMGLLKKKEGTKRATSGNKVIVSSQNDLLQEAETKGLKGRGRSILESTSYVSQEAEESKKNGIEDIVVTDYANPHRKPPIHNEIP